MFTSPKFDEWNSEKNGVWSRYFRLEIWRYHFLVGIQPVKLQGCSMIKNRGVVDCTLDCLQGQTAGVL